MLERFFSSRKVNANQFLKFLVMVPSQEFSVSLGKLYKQELSQEEVISAEKNLFGFMSLLIEVDQQNNSAKK